MVKARNIFVKAKIFYQHHFPNAMARNLHKVVSDYRVARTKGLVCQKNRRYARSRDLQEAIRTHWLHLHNMVCLFFVLILHSAHLASKLCLSFVCLHVINVFWNCTFGAPTVCKENLVICTPPVLSNFFKEGGSCLSAQLYVCFPPHIMYMGVLVGERYKPTQLSCPWLFFQAQHCWWHLCMAIT